jgi:hypothetical protein
MNGRHRIVWLALAWAASAPLLAASEETPAGPKIDFRYGYYPSHHKLRFLAVSPPADKTDWQVVLTAQGSAAALAQQSGRLPFRKSGKTIDVPDLPEGSYELTLTLTGAGQPVQVNRTFTRNRFPWENNTLGKDPVVVPPFTPLTVDESGPAVQCILRRHVVSPAGLWQQVVSQQVPLLDAPVHLRASVGGQRHVAAGAGTVFTKKADTQVSGQASWTAGPLRGLTRFDYDYDGFMKATLEVEPSPEPVDALDLVIPLQAREAWLMHAVTDLLRSHYAGKIPEGRGKVWDSANVPRYQLPGPFLPYIWIGGTERGIAWIAENDRDWILDPKAPTHELVREGDAISLVVHFVTKPARIERRRRIVFALMATPAKPMPDQPSSHRAWWPVTTATAEGVDFTLAGACYYWGGQTACLQFYPAFRNFSYFDEVARVRASGNVDLGFTDRWLSQFTGPRYPDDLKKTYRAHVDCMMNYAKNARRTPPGAPKRNWLIPYTNPRAAPWDPEMQTYLDEWSIYDIADPRWSEAVAAKTDIGHCGQRMLREKSREYDEHSGVAYEVDPLPSYADMALYYHQKMYDTFADGVYWDDFFVLANSNPVSGPAYIDDDGALHPGVSWFAFRDLARRNAVMQHRRGMRPLSWIHMTNCNVVPALSFGTILFEWEWHDQGDYARMDFQDRLGADDDTGLILAQSTGLQSGNLVVSLDLLRPPAGSGVSREWLVRTALAVCVPHEIKLPAWEADHRKVIGLFDGMGYGRPECRVFRYWDPEPPLTTSVPKVKTLLLSRPGKALVFVGSYGPGGDCALALDLGRLGLPPDAPAVNGETGKPVQRSGPGRFVVPIRKHDFQIVVVGGGP